MAWSVKPSPGAAWHRQLFSSVRRSRVLHGWGLASARLVSALCVIEPLVAVAWANAFARIQGANLSVLQSFILFAGFWLVYMADHWLDAASANGTALVTARHAFAASHRRSVAGAWTLTLGLSLLVSAVSLSLNEWCGGLAIAALALLYLGVVHRKGATRFQLRSRGAKELVVAVAFGAGTTLFLWTNGSYGLLPGVANGLFALLVLQNLITIADFERDIDRHHGMPSVASRTPTLDCPLHRYCLALCCACCLFSVVTALKLDTHLPALYLSVAASSLGLQAVYRMQRVHVEVRHVLADLAVLGGALLSLIYTTS